MRPAQKARDNLRRDLPCTLQARASMRPAQKARDNDWTRGPISKMFSASMRPAQKARDNDLGVAALRIDLDGFNEARAKSTG